MRSSERPPATLGARIRALREKRGLTQAELADAVGMHREDLVRLETGSRGANPTLSRLMAIAAALSVDVGELLPKSRAA